jgi:hypothetical protein
MAFSKSIACNSTFFEVVTKEPRGSNYKVNFIQCSACGAVVGVMEYLNAGQVLTNLKKDVAELKRAISSVADDVDRIRRSLK